MKNKDYEIHKYLNNDADCDDCEEGEKNIARWVIIGAGPYGYLYVCNMHMHDFVDNAEQDY
jgi:hypothetical protein